MKTSRASFRLALCAAAMACCSIVAAAIAPPAGWTRTQDGAVETFQPGDLANNEVFSIAVHPASRTAGRPLSAWLDAWAADKVPGVASGKVASSPGNDGTSATGQVMFRDAQGRSLIAMFVAVSMDRDRVRAMRIVATPDAALFARQKPAIGQFVARLATDEAAGYKSATAAAEPPDTHVATQSANAAKAAARAGVPRGSRTGGPFRFGTYEFEFPLPAINQVRRYRISFYENGEYRKVEGSSEDNGKFTYDPATGALNVSVLLNLYNSSYDEADFCRLYIAPDGNPWIYAEDEYGVGTHRITGRYAGANERRNPKEEDAAKSAARAEANRFKWVTAPGQGVAMEQISGILHQLEQVYEIGGLQLHEYTYLLLRDGSVYRNLRCPPDQLDAAASRRNEPRQWGHWRKSGSRYELQFPNADGSFGAWSAPAMTSLVRPGARGERLQGHYRNASSYQIPGGAGAVTYLGISFAADGRFETDFFSMVGGSTGYGEQTITTGAVATDEGAVSSVSGPNFGGGTRRKSDRSRSERTGRYTIDGYSLLLQFDDGKVERLPFFFAYSGKNDIWFRGAVYSIPKNK